MPYLLIIGLLAKWIFGSGDDGGTSTQSYTATKSPRVKNLRKASEKEEQETHDVEEARKTDITIEMCPKCGEDFVAKRTNGAVEEGCAECGYDG